MIRTGRARSRLALLRWSVVGLALVAVALLHAIQSVSSGVTPVRPVAIEQYVTAHAPQQPPPPARAAGPVAAVVRDLAPVVLPTGAGDLRHPQVPSGPGLAAGVCLVLLASVGIDTLLAARHGPRRSPPAGPGAGPTIIRGGPRPALIRLGVLRM